MKQFTLAVVAGIGMTTLVNIAGAQVALTDTWGIDAPSAGIIPNDNSSRGIAYHSASDRVLIARSSSPFVKLLNAATGADAGNLQEGIITTSGTQLIRMAKAKPAADGAIYAATVTNAATQTFNIYRWADADTATMPTIAFTTGVGAYGTTRMGDTIAVKGSGVNTVIAVGGSGAGFIRVFTTTDGVNFTEAAGPTYTSPITIATGTPNQSTSAATGLAFRPDNNDLIIKASGAGYTQISPTGTVLAVSNNATVNASSADMELVDIGGVMHLLTETGNAAGARRAKVYNITSGLASATLISQSPITTTNNANTNGTGGASYDPSRGAIVWLSTNNRVASSTAGGQLPVELDMFQID
jgi:hypothetical protein